MKTRSKLERSRKLKGEATPCVEKSFYFLGRGGCQIALTSIQLFQLII